MSSITVHFFSLALENQTAKNMQLLCTTLGLTNIYSLIVPHNNTVKGCVSTGENVIHTGPYTTDTNYKIIFFPKYIVRPRNIFENKGIYVFTAADVPIKWRNYQLQESEPALRECFALCVAGLLLLGYQVPSCPFNVFFFCTVLYDGLCFAATENKFPMNNI